MHVPCFHVRKQWSAQGSANTKGRIINMLDSCSTLLSSSKSRHKAITQKTGYGLLTPQSACTALLGHRKTSASVALFQSLQCTCEVMSA